MNTIAISGSTCVGKTSLIEKLKLHFSDAYVIRERAEDNPFYSACIGGENGSSFKGQLMFYIQYLQDLSNCLNNKFNGTVFFDRIVDDHMVISTFRHSVGELTDSELYICSQFANTIKQISPPINKMIYLHCSVKTVLERMSKRDKAWDRNVDEGFLIKMTDAYDKWFHEYVNNNPQIKTLSINTEEQIDFDRIIKFIEE